MRIESNLCHASDNKVIVKVTGWKNGNALGSALAEGKTVEDAEDKAISRLNSRINSSTIEEKTINTTKIEKSQDPMKDEIPTRNNIQNINYKNEPSDWSNELTAIDLEIKRLEWSRDDEIKFLQKTIGYNNRNKITKYSDITKYLSLLKKENKISPSKLDENKINTFLEESDRILKDLSWNNVQGREYLKREFNVATRKDLNEDQLILFVEKLKCIRNQYLTQ